MSKFCKMCGAELPDDALFCSECGSDESNNDFQDDAGEYAGDASYAEESYDYSDGSSEYEDYSSEYEDYSSDYDEPDGSGKTKKVIAVTVVTILLLGVLALAAFVWPGFLKGSKPIVGKWVGESGETWTFKEDGKAIYTENGRTRAYTYELSGNKVTITGGSGEIMQYVYTIGANTLSFWNVSADGEKGQTLYGRYVRAGSSEDKSSYSYSSFDDDAVYPGSDFDPDDQSSSGDKSGDDDSGWSFEPADDEPIKIDERLIGKWISIDNEDYDVTFNEYEGIIEGASFKATSKKGVFLIESAGVIDDYPTYCKYKINGDVLTITYGDGSVERFHRSDEPVEPDEPDEHDKTVRSIEVYSKPSKTQYYINDTFDSSGLQLKVYYSNGETTVIKSGFSASADLSKAGNTWVGITYSGKTTGLNVTVNTPAISNLPSSYDLAIGCEKTFYPSTEPANQSISWSTSNSSAVQVTNSGKIKAVKIGSSANITASFTYKGKTYSKKISVTVPTPSVSVSSNQPANITRHVQNDYTMYSGRLCWKISLKAPSYSPAIGTFGDGGDNGRVRSSGITTEWQPAGSNSYVLFSGPDGTMYVTQPGSYSMNYVIKYKGYVIKTYKVTTTLKLVMTAYKDGNNIRTSHSKSAEKIGFINAGTDNLEVKECWVSGTPKVSGTSVWGYITYDGVTGWSQIFHWE